MTETSPFFNGVMSPHGALNIGATMLSPDETPSYALLKSLQGAGVDTPSLPIPSTLLATTVQKSKKRQRDDSVASLLPNEQPQEHCFYKIVPCGKVFQLQPYVVRLLEEMLAQGTTSVLKKPLAPDTLSTESKEREKIRHHLSSRFMPVTSGDELVVFTQKLLQVWDAKLVSTLEDVNGNSSNVTELITPLRRTGVAGNESHSSKAPSNDQKLDDLDDGELLQLDFLDEENNENQEFEEMSLTEHATAGDNWTRAPKNARRVTCHESPPLSVSHKSSMASSSEKGSLEKEGKEPKAKKAKSSSAKRGVRWTKAERKLFLQGLEKWGAGNWKSIHKIIPGRTYVQVKSMGVYLVSKFHMSRGQGPSKAVMDYLMQVPPSAS